MPIINYYSGKRADSNYLYDLKGGINATLIGTLKPNGWVGFNGTSQYAYNTNWSGLGNSWTITMLFRSSNYVSSGKSIFRVRPASGDGNEIRFGFSVSKIWGLIVDSAGSSGNKYKDYSGGTTLINNNTYIAQATWNGTDLNIYLDGKKETLTKTTDGSVTQSDTTRKLGIGGWDAVAYTLADTNIIITRNEVLSPANLKNEFIYFKGFF